MLKKDEKKYLNENSKGLPFWTTVAPPHRPALFA